MIKYFFTIILVVIYIKCSAQIDLECNGRDQHSIYLCCYDPLAFYRIDSVDTNPTNPILLTTNFPDPFAGEGGISINNNLDSLSGPQTMYFIGNTSSSYFFWNGTGWTNTNNHCGSISAINIGGTSNYLFNLDGNGNAVYRYDGNGNDTLLLSNLNSYYSIYDVATDNLGNFYLFFTNLQKIYSYDSMGILIDTFTTTGFPSSIHPGFAILGHRLYALANSIGSSVDLYEGIQVGSIINFTFLKNIGLNVSDIATCPEAGKPLSNRNSHTQQSLSVYPNPFRGELNINFGDVNSITEVLLFDLTSRLILQQSFLNIVSINTEQLAKGIYFYELRNKNVVINKGKVLKE